MLEPLLIKGDEVTPFVNFNYTTGKLVMGGMAVPENVKEMFSPIREWLELYQKQPQPATEFVLNFEYLNTAATKMVFEIANTVSNLHGRENCRVKITWKYLRGDAEMRELGEEILDEFVCLKEIAAVDSLH